MVVEPTDPAERLERELDRVLTRLGALGPQRLVRPDAEGTAPADRVRGALAGLAEAAADAEGVPRRPLPVLAAHALADQLVVLVRDLARAAADQPAATGELAGTADRLADLRRRL